MSDELIKTLNASLMKANGEAAKYRTQRKEALDKLAAAEARIAEMEKAAGKPDAWKERAEKAESALLTIRHRDAFAGKLAGKLRDKATVEDVWSKAGYTPSGEPPTEEAIDELLGKAREAAPFIFVEEGQEPTTPPGGATQVPATAPPPGAGRGAPGTTSGRMVITSANLADPAWMAVNQGKIAAAQADGTLLVSG